MPQTYEMPLVGGEAQKDSRTKINNSFEAVRTLFRGATAPVAVVAGQPWEDTTTDLLKLRNSTNDGDIVLGKMGDADTNLGHVRRDGTDSIMTGALGLAGQRLNIDADADTYLRSTTDDQVDLYVAGSIAMSIEATNLNLRGLRLKDMKNDATTTVGAAVGRGLVDVGGVERAVLIYAKS